MLRLIVKSFEISYVCLWGQTYDAEVIKWRDSIVDNLDTLSEDVSS